MFSVHIAFSESIETMQYFNEIVHVQSIERHFFPVRCKKNSFANMKHILIFIKKLG